MNTMKKIMITGLLCLIGWGGIAQVISLQVDQPDPLMANAGVDTLLCKNHSIILGTSQTATGGSPDYFYTWYPDLYLDNPTLANPTSNPEETITYMLTVIDNQGCTATSFVSIGIDPCLGIENENLNTEISVYPNPAKDYFVVQGLPLDINELEISVINYLGQTLIKHSIKSHSLSSEIRIDTNEGLLPGVYFVRIRINNQVITKSIHII